MPNDRPAHPPAPPRPDPRLLRLAPNDNVYVLTASVAAGECLWLDAAPTPTPAPSLLPVRVPVALPLGHKLAARRIAAGEQVVKYGVSIGSALQDIAPGDHVHTHNLRSDYFPTYLHENQAGFFARH